jgi:hypothetical protein
MHGILHHLVGDPHGSGNRTRPLWERARPAHPGGNVAGLSFVALETSGSRGTQSARDSRETQLGAREQPGKRAWPSAGDPLLRETA